MMKVNLINDVYVGKYIQDFGDRVGPGGVECGAFGKKSDDLLQKSSEDEYAFRKTEFAILIQ